MNQRIEQSVFVAAKHRSLNIKRVFHKVKSTLKRYHQRYRQRQQLLSLGADQLKDIGISRYDALAEGKKPFWRG